MQRMTPSHLPKGAALPQWAARIMDVILHLGAHRTATTCFQNYMRRHSDALSRQGVGFWGPRVTRRGLHAGLMENFGNEGLGARPQALSDKLDRASHQNIQKLVVSDENMLGSVRQNIRDGALYPRAAERLRNFGRAYEHCVSAVLFSPRSLETYWCSALAYGVGRGVAVPDRRALRAMALARRGWRDVICDISAALPGVDLRILPFERYAGRPQAMLAQGVGVTAPAEAARCRENEAPRLPHLRRLMMETGRDASVLPLGMGRWNPFANDEHAALRELHADDMMWLAAGADGLATLTEDSHLDEAGPTPTLVTYNEGRSDELEERQLARPG